jgi:hypothetical protein
MRQRGGFRLLARPFTGGMNVPLLRIIVGFLGMALPVIVVVWGLFITEGHVQNSLSDYYSLRTRDAFVGILFVIGWILFAYRGYSNMDAVAGKLVWIFATLVALFPNSAGGWQGKVHYASAGCMFAVLFFFSTFLFTKTGASPQRFGATLASAFRRRAAEAQIPQAPEKAKRNIVYKICGWLILAGIVLIGAYQIFGRDTFLADIKPVLVLETMMIWAFGFAWLVKGEVVWKDRETPAVQS